MSVLRTLWSRVAATLRRTEDDRRLEEELDLHLAFEAEALVKQGLDAQAARREAHRRLGGRVAVEEAWRDQRRLPWVDVLRQDARYAVRGLRRDPRFTLLALATLACGIGATTAIFGLLKGVVLSPLPYPEPDRLVRIYEASPRFTAFPVSPWSYLSYRRDNHTLADIAVYTREDLQLAMDDRPERLRALQVSASYFPVLGARPAIGRAFGAADERERAAVVVISDGLWRRRFGADPAIVGRLVRLSGRAFTVIGVMPPHFEHVGGAYRSMPQGDSVDAWWPLPLEQAYAHRQWHYINAVGRLKPGVTAAQARDDLDWISAALAPQLANVRWAVRTVPLADDVVGASRAGLVLLMGAVALVLIIACANVASLLLARATARTRERSVRYALGATRGRLARQALAEAAVLMAPAAVLGSALAWAGTRGLHALLPPDFPRLHNVHVDAGVLVFCASICAVAVVVFGLVPSWRAPDADGLAGLQDGGARSSAGRRTTRLRQALVVSEIALASALVVAGGLLVQSFVRLQRASPGFVPDRAVTAVVALPEARYERPEDAARFFDRLVAEVGPLPGVVAAGVGTDIPWTGYDENTGFDIVGRAGEGPEPNARFHVASPGYFQAAGIRLVAGRVMDERDTSTAPPVVVVNEALARKYFTDGPAVGRVVDIWDAKRTIVGIVEDVKDQPADAEATPAFWWPSAQVPRASMTLVVRTATDDPSALVPDLRRVVARLDAQLPLADVRTLGDVAANANAQRRFLLAMTMLFAIVALSLAAIGSYGVLSWTVRQRVRELGIRMALGADQRAVLGLVLGQGLRLALAGLAAGLAIALVSGRVLAGLLYGITATDGGTFAAASMLMLGLCTFAALGPALTATRTSPVDALRTD